MRRKQYNHEYYLRRAATDPEFVERRRKQAREYWARVKKLKLKMKPKGKKT
jgi:hypothetical protein